MSTNIANTHDVCMNKAKELRFHVVSPGLIIAKRADVITIAGKKALTNVKDLFLIAKLKERKPEGDYVMFPADVTESHADVKQCKIGNYSDLKKLIIENHSKGVFYAS
jgi:hypothetical protein